MRKGYGQFYTLNSIAAGKDLENQRPYFGFTHVGARKPTIVRFAMDLSAEVATTN
jgi:hypothetical protein